MICDKKKRKANKLIRFRTAMFCKLNQIHLHNIGPFNMINSGSFFFREKLWTSREMGKIMKEIAEEAIKYYLNKYGKENFI